MAFVYTFPVGLVLGWDIKCRLLRGSFWCGAAYGYAYVWSPSIAVRLIFFFLLCCWQLQFGCCEYCIRCFLSGTFLGMCYVGVVPLIEGTVVFFMLSSLSVLF